MDIQIKPGTYVVAVSGGVDSMVLLDLLAARPELELVVAHYDHGIRPESRQDREFVQAAADRYGLPFVWADGNLGSLASEDTARKARYVFLRQVCAEHGAAAIVTAHHGDDLLETAILNLIRGTGRKGLSSLQNTGPLLRPLLTVRKQDVLAYARARDIGWRDDPTNQDTKYLRNHIRHFILPRMAASPQRELMIIIQKMMVLNNRIDTELKSLLADMSQDGRLQRHAFIMLPHAVALEIMASWLRSHEIRDFDTKTLERLVHAAKIKAAGKRVDVCRGIIMNVNRLDLALTQAER